MQKFISLLSIAPWGNPAYDGLVEKMSVRQPEAQQEKFKKDGWFYAPQSVYGTKCVYYDRQEFRSERRAICNSKL